MSEVMLEKYMSEDRGMERTKEAKQVNRKRKKSNADRGEANKTGSKNKSDGINLNELPETIEVKQEFNPSKELEKCWIDPNVKIKEPPTVLEVNGITTLTMGNISTVIGKAKSRKTFLVVGLISAISKGSWEPMRGHISDSTVLWFDTEQSSYHASKMVQRCYELGAREVKAYSTRPYTPSQRLELIETAIYNTPNLGFVVIDGVRDLLSRGINDEEEATSITSKFLKWTAEKEIHICVVLHTNKGDTNARGHIGSELTNKSEVVFSVAKSEQDSSVSIVKSEYSRNTDFEPFAFSVDDTGLPWFDEMSTDLETKRKVSPQYVKDDKHWDVLDAIFERESRYAYTEMWRNIKVEFSRRINPIGDNKAKDILTYYQNKDWIQKDEGNKYVYTMKQI